MGKLGVSWNILCFSLIILFSSSGYSSDFVTAGGLPACTTQKSLDEAWISMIIAKDMKWFDGITNCVMTKAGIRITVMEFHGVSYAKIRLHLPSGERPLVLYTDKENIVER